MTEGGTPVGANQSCAPSPPVFHSPKTPTATPVIVRALSGLSTLHVVRQNLFRLCPLPLRRVANTWHPLSAEIPADLIPYRLSLSRQPRVPLGSRSFPL